MSGLDACLRSDLRAGVMVVGTIAFLLMSFAGVTYYGLVGLAMAQVAQGVFLVISGWVLVRRVMQSKALLPVQWSTARFREMLGYGVNFQINSFVMLLFEPMTKILLGRYGELAAAGYFEMAQRLVMKVRALIVESNRVIVPVFAGMESSGGGAKKLYVTNFRYLFFLVTPIFAGLLSLIPTISELWIGSYERQFVIMTMYSTVAWYINSITAPAYFAYLGQGTLRWVTLAHIVMGVINILGGFIFGALFGWQGVIAAFAAALVIGSVLPVFAYHREHHLSLAQILNFRDVMLAIVCFVSAIVALNVYLVMLSMDGSKWLRIVLISASMCIVALTAVWLHPMRRQIVTIVRSKWMVRRQRINES
jgi:O-antigen/teichoic acid export membrane protein